MAGDHKCPVCQATFTRPQHVARHMRSHTGDRPYKCQHCGDQFARSDLLSRHVNKCHAGDKPPTTTAPNRRKGQHGASSTRATTSKQACDQCVMATLPCDGANPCSKCLQRKTPCTYVKFQRQTAPSGPGHKHNPSVESTSSTASNLSIPRPDELFLGPPPMTVPSMAQGDLFYPHQAQFAFNAPHGVASWEDSPNPPSLTLSSSTADSGHDSSSSDITGRYRNAEMLRSAVLPPGYTAHSAPFSGYYGNTSVSGVSPDQWQMQSEYVIHGDGQLGRRDKMQESFAQYLPPGSSASHTAGPSSLLHPSNLDFQGGGLYNLHPRRGSIDGYSDGGSANSAASSSAHLPLDFGSSGDQQQQQSLDFSAYSNQFDDGPRPPPSRDGRFASSFGLMSLADGDGSFAGNFNNVEGNAPFFSQTAMKLPPQDSTPRPFRGDEDLSHTTQNSNSTRDREAEMRELREFWKQYLRTPLSGPSLGQTPKAELLNQFGTLADSRPTPKRGLSRVASLPSVRTPPDEKSAALPSRLSQSHVAPTPGPRAPQTTDDLRSYEQAVLARKAPVNLNLVPKKGRRSNTSSVSPGNSPAISQQNPQTTQGRQPGTFLEPGPNNIPGANPLGMSRLQTSGISGDQTSDNRPSFKRLPSQTLENSVQKRALFHWNGTVSEEAIDDGDSDVDGSTGGYPSTTRSNAQYGGVHIPETLADRFRRQSAPTTLRPGLSDLGFSNEQGHGHMYSSMNGHHRNGSPASHPDQNTLVRS